MIATQGWGSQERESPPEIKRRVNLASCRVRRCINGLHIQLLHSQSSSDIHPLTISAASPGRVGPKYFDKRLPCLKHDVHGLLLLLTFRFSPYIKDCPACSRVSSASQTIGVLETECLSCCGRLCEWVYKVEYLTGNPAAVSFATIKVKCSLCRLEPFSPYFRLSRE